MTVSDMAVGVAVPHGTASRGFHASALTRARARASVADATTQRARRRGFGAASTATGFRRFGRVVYLDATDSWIVRGRTLSVREVFRADYAVPGSYGPFVVWCRVYRYPAAGWAAVCDAAKWLGVHPVRGPLTVLVLNVSAALVGLAVAG